MKKLLLLTSCFAFDSNVGAWKLDEEGHVILQDGNPVLIHNGTEMTVGSDTIVKTNAEAKKHRLEKEAALKQLEVFSGLDAKEAREAIDKLKEVDLSKMVAADKLDEVRNEINRQAEEKIGKFQEEANTYKSKYEDKLLDSVFTGSEFIKSNIAVPLDLFESGFRKNFKVDAETGEVAAFDTSGNRIMSKKRVGEVADTEEALAILVEHYPQRDSILRADTQSGSGGSKAGGMKGAARIIKRSEFDSLPANKKADIALKAGTGELRIVD